MERLSGGISSEWTAHCLVIYFYSSTTSGVVEEELEIVSRVAVTAPTTPSASTAQYSRVEIAIRRLTDVLWVQAVWLYETRYYTTVI